MAVLKCKMCGGVLEIMGTETITKCEYCDSVQTVPTVDNEKKIALFSRANDLRRAYEFDKAAGVYETIVGDFPEEAEAYWGLALCKYGIEYVDDEQTGKKIPTCHRLRPTPMLEDADYLRALEKADAIAKDTYRQSGEDINNIQKQIMSIASQEKPYDIFICFKDKDENGNRTDDSSIAQDIYTELTREGYKVFFSRVTLRSHAGTEYEPYIYAALSSAKVMLCLATKFEYFDAVWVKNEWSRFITMMHDDKSKILIPCYQDMDIDDMPKEFRNMQALDMSNVLFFSDLLENVRRIIGAKKQESAQNANVGNTATVDTLIKRVFIFLEDADFDSADSYCEKVLDIDPENALAYLGKLMVNRRATKRADLDYQKEDLNKFGDFIKAVKFADVELKAELLSYRNESIYNHGSSYITAVNENPGADYASIMEMKKKFDLADSILSVLDEYKDADAKLKEAGKRLKEKALHCARSMHEKLILSRSEDDFAKAAELFKLGSDEAEKDIHAMIVDFGDAIVAAAQYDKDYNYAAEVYQRAQKCAKATEQLNICRRMQAEFQNDCNYRKALSLKNQNSLDTVEQAIKMFVALNEYRDSKEQIVSCQEKKVELTKEDNYKFAIKNLFSDDLKVLNKVKNILSNELDYKESNSLLTECEKRITLLERQEKEQKLKMEKQNEKNRKLARKKQRKQAYIRNMDSFGMKWLYWIATTGLFVWLGIMASDSVDKVGTLVFGSDYFNESVHIAFSSVPFVLSLLWSILKKRRLWIWGLIGAIVFVIVSFDKENSAQTIYVWNCVYAAVAYLSCWIAISMDYDDKWDVGSGGGSSSSSSCACNGTGGCY